MVSELDTRTATLLGACGPSGCAWPQASYLSEQKKSQYKNLPVSVWGLIEAHVVMSTKLRGCEANVPTVPTQVLRQRMLCKILFDTDGAAVRGRSRASVLPYCVFSLPALPTFRGATVRGPGLVTTGLHNMEVSVRAL